MLMAAYRWMADSRVRSLAGGGTRFGADGSLGWVGYERSGEEGEDAEYVEFV